MGIFQKFVRSNERPAALPESEPFFLDDETPVNRPHGNRGRKHALDRTESLNAVLAFLSANQGKVVGYDDIASATGFSQGYTSVLVTDLLSKKAVSRKGKRGSFTYTVKSSRVNRPRRAKAAKVTPTKAAATSHREGRAKYGTAVEKVYRFLERNEDKRLSQTEIARGAGVGGSTVSQSIKKLVQDKRIVASDYSKEGTRYWLYNSIEDAPQAEEVTNLIGVVDALAWDFIKETGSLSVVAFLDWLNKKNQ